MPAPAWLSSDPLERKRSPRDQRGWAPRPKPRIRQIRVGWDIPGAGVETPGMLHTDPSPADVTQLDLGAPTPTPTSTPTPTPTSTPTPTPTSDYQPSTADQPIPVQGTPDVQPIGVEISPGQDQPQPYPAPPAEPATPLETQPDQQQQQPSSAPAATAQPAAATPTTTAARPTTPAAPAAPKPAPPGRTLKQFLASRRPAPQGRTLKQYLTSRQTAATTGGTTTTGAPSNSAGISGPQSKQPGDYIDMTRQAAIAAGIDPDIFALQIQQESHFNPNARSAAGAVGIAQIVPRYHPGVNPNDPQASLSYAAQDMKRLLDKYGTWDLALAAYNAGEGALAQYGGVPPFQETRNYLNQILGGARNVQNVAATEQTAASAAAPGLLRQHMAAIGQGAAINSPDLGQHATAARTSQFQMGLSSGDAYAFCGPAAAIAFAQTYGRNPTVPEAKQLAQQVGWTQTQGMAGPQSEVALLQRLGIAAHYAAGAINWNQVAQQAQSGNPVILDTPGHYFYVDGYNPQNGQFHVGTSGTDLRGGSEWMTPAQIGATRMGQVRGAIYADHPLASSGAGAGQDEGQTIDLRTVDPSTLDPQTAAQVSQIALENQRRGEQLAGYQQDINAIQMASGEQALPSTAPSDVANWQTIPAAPQPSALPLPSTPPPSGPSDVTAWPTITPPAAETPAATAPTPPPPADLTAPPEEAAPAPAPSDQQDISTTQFQPAGTYPTTPLEAARQGALDVLNKVSQAQVPGFPTKPPDLPPTGSAAGDIGQAFQQAVTEASQRPYPGITPGGFGIRDPRLEAGKLTPSEAEQGAALGGLLSLPVGEEGGVAVGPAGERLAAEEARAASEAGIAGRAVTPAELINQIHINQQPDRNTGLGSLLRSRTSAAAKVTGEIGGEAVPASDRALRGPIADRLVQAAQQAATPEQLAQATARLAEITTSGGRAIGAPAQAATAEGLAALRARVNVLADEGASQRFWYRDSSQVIDQVTQGNKINGEKIAQLLGIYSGKTGVDNNLHKALTAWYQFQEGQPIRVAMAAQDKRASDLLYRNAQWEGRKTNNFYRNLMQFIDPAVYAQLGRETGQSGVTVDEWMMRAFDYLATAATGRKWRKAPSGRQYDFIQSEVERIATERGWKPEETQAAIWAAIKAAAEGTGVDTAGFHYGNAIENRLAQVSWETSPGTAALQKIPGYAEASEAERQRYHQFVSGALLDENGRDILAQEFGLIGGSSFDAPGIYRGQLSPGTQTEFAVPEAAKSAAGKQLKENVGRVQAPARAALDAYSAGRGILYEQDAVPWHRAFKATNQRDANAVAIVIGEGRVITADEAQQLDAALRDLLGEDAHAIVPTRKGTRVLNTGDMPNPQFHKTVAQALDRVESADTFRDGPVRADGEYVSNDWSSSPNGEAYRNTIRQSGDRFDAGWRRLEAPLTRRVREAQDLAAKELGWPSRGSIASARQLGQAIVSYPIALGGAAAGGLAGYQTAPERASPEERVARAAAGAAAGLVAGAAGPALLLRVLPEADREAAIADRLAPELRDTPQGQAIVKQISAAANPGPYLENEHSSGLQTARNMAADEARQLAAPADNATVQHVVQRAALDLNDQQLLADLRAIPEQLQGQPMSMDLLSKTVFGGVVRNNPEISMREALQRTDLIMRRGLSRQPARARLAGTMRWGVSGAQAKTMTVTAPLGAAAGYAYAYQHTDRNDPNYSRNLVAGALVVGMMGVGLPYFGGLLNRSAGAKGWEVAANTFAPMVLLQSDSVHEAMMNFVGGHTGGTLAGKLFEEGTNKIWGKDLNAMLAADIEEANALPGVHAGDPRKQIWLDAWRDVAGEGSQLDILGHGPIDFSNPDNPANLYWPHMTTEDWKDLLTTRPSNDAERATGGYGGMSRSPLYTHTKQRTFQSMHQGMVATAGLKAPIFYTDEQARLLGSYVAKVHQEKALRGLIDALKTIGASGKDPDVFVQAAGDIRAASPRGPWVPLGQYNQRFEGLYASPQLADVVANMFDTRPRSGGARMLSDTFDMLLDAQTAAKHNLLGLSGFHAVQEVFQYGRAMVGGYAERGLPGMRPRGAYGQAGFRRAPWVARTARAVAEVGFSPMRMAVELKQMGGRVLTQDQFERYLASDPTQLLHASHVLTPGMFRAYSASNASRMLEAVSRSPITLNMSRVKQSTGRQVVAALLTGLGGTAGGFQLAQSMGATPEQTIAAAAAGGAAGVAASLVPLRLGRVGPLAVPRPGGELVLANNINEMLFGRAIPYMKFRTYELYAPTYGARAAGEFANQVFGGENLLAAARSRNVQDLMRVFALSPDWQINWGKQLGHALFDWSGPLGEMNRTYWATTAVTSAIMLELGNLAFGGHWSWDNDPQGTLMIDMSQLYKTMGWKSVDKNGNPVKPYLDFLGPIRGMLEPMQELTRAGVQGLAEAYNLQDYPLKAEIAGDVRRGIPHPDPKTAVWNFVQGRAGIGLRSLDEMVQGRDYAGRPIDVATDPGWMNVGRRVVNTLGQLQPIGPGAAFAGGERGDPGPIAILSGTLGFRVRRVSPQTKRYAALDQLARNNGMDAATQYDVQQHSAWLNDDISIQTQRVLNDPKMTPQAPPGQPRSAGGLDKIFSLEAQRKSQYKQYLDWLQQHYNYHVGDPVPPQFQQAKDDLDYIFGIISQGGTQAPADVTAERPDLDPAELYRMAWQPPASAGIPQRVLADAGITAANDWIPKVGGLDENNQRALASAHLVQIAQVAEQQNLDPEVLQDLVKAHLYGNGQLPDLPNMSSAALDDVTNQFHALSEMDPGPERTAAQQQVIDENAQQYGVDAAKLRQRVIWRMLPLSEQPQVNKAFSQATDLQTKTKEYLMARVDPSSPTGLSAYGPPDQEAKARDAVAAAKATRADLNPQYIPGRRGADPVFLDSSGNESAYLAEANHAMTLGSAARQRALQADPQTFGLWNRVYGRGKYLTNQQWQQLGQGTLQGAFRDLDYARKQVGDNPSVQKQLADEEVRRMKILDKWATMTPDERKDDNQPMVPLMQQNDDGSLSQVQVYISEAAKYLTSPTQPGHLDLAHLGQDPSQPDGLT